MVVMKMIVSLLRTEFQPASKRLHVVMQMKTSLLSDGG